MFRKNRFFLVILILLLTLAVVSGCGGGEEVPDGAEGEKQNQVKSLVIGSGGAGGSWYLLGAQMSELLKNELPDIPVSVVEGGAISNVRLTDGGQDMDVGMASLPNILDALSHKGPFKEDNINNVAPVINFATDFVQFTVLADSGIDGFEDLADKRILPGPKGWGIEALTQKILDMYGLSYEKVKENGGEISFVSWGEAPSLLKDGHADMAAFKGAIPISNIMEIEATNKAKVLGLDENKVEEFLKGKEGYFKGSIPAGSYKGQSTDALTIGHTSVLFVNKNLPEDLVYDITRILMENHDKFNQIEGVLIGEDPLKGIDPALLHPGAKRYYEEKGLL